MRPAAGTPAPPRALRATLLLAALATLLALPAQALAISAPLSPTAPSPTRAKPVLTWAVPSDPGLGVAGYNVYRGVTRLTAVPTTALTYTDALATANTSPTHTVRAVETGTGLESAASAVVTVIYDTTVPPAPTGLASAAAITNQKPALTWAHAGTDNLSGLAGFRVLRAGTLVATLASSARSFTDTGLALAGSTQYQVKAFDLAGNESSAASTTVIYDNIPPAVPSSASLPTAAQRVFPVITWGASTDTGGAGILRYEISRDGTSIGQSTTTTFTDATLTAQGTYAYTVVAVDKAGNVGSPTASRLVTYDTAAPTAPTALGSTVTPTKLQPSLAWDGLDGRARRRHGLPHLPRLDPRGHRQRHRLQRHDARHGRLVRVHRHGRRRRRQRRALAAASAATTVVYDKTAPPKPEALAGASPTNQKPLLSWTSGGGDTLSGFSHYEVWRGTTLAGTTTGTTFTDAALSTSGPQSYTVKAVDLAGNASVASTARAITYDVVGAGHAVVPDRARGHERLADDLVGERDRHGRQRHGALPHLPGRRARRHRGLDLVHRSRGRRERAVRLQRGRRRQRRQRGPEGRPEDGLVRHDRPDRGGPTGATPTKAKPVLSWSAGTDGGSGVATYVILANGVQAGTSTTPTFTHTSLSTNGTYTYEVQVVDRAGNTSALSSPFVLAYDSTAPSQPGSLTGTTPTATAPALTWSASSDALSGLARYEVYRGQTLAGAVTPPATSFTDVALAAAGTYAYTVKAVDVAGNVSAASLAKSIVYDPVAPAAPGNLGGITPTSRPVLTWSPVTDTSGIVRYDVYRDGDPVGSSGTTSFTDATVTSEGVVAYAVRAIDGAGNVSALSASRSFTVDLTAPPCRARSRAPRRRPSSRSSRGRRAAPTRAPASRSSAFSPGTARRSARARTARTRTAR